MKLESILHALIPKEAKFFKYFEEDVENLLLAAGVFKGLMSDAISQAERAQKVAHIEELEHRGDEITHTTGVLVTSRIIQTFEVPVWVVFSSHTAIAFGTLFGGWRIVKTMGSKITKLQPTDGFCAETAGGITLLLTAFGGIAVSTKHTIAGAIMGVGATKRFSAVRWGIAGTMVWAWILTIPMSALVAAGTYWLIETVRALWG